MVIDNKTLRTLHPLSKEGELYYKEMLQEKADELILKTDHPFLCILYKLTKLSKIDNNLIERKYNNVLKEIKENRL